MKSLANGVLNIAVGILADVKLAYPHLRGVERDSNRLTLGCGTRGLGFFTLDLPNLHSTLLQGLETGRLCLNGPAVKQVSKRIQVPRLFSGLWLRVFDKSGCLLDDPDVTAIAFLKQLSELGKKVQVLCSPKRLEAALENYHDIESKLREPSLQWFNDEFDPCNNGHTLHFCDGMDVDLPLFPELQGQGRDLKDVVIRCQQAADIVSKQFGFFEPVTFSEGRYDETGKSGFRHGPGAVADRRGLVNKYDMPRWSSKLEQWFPYRECGTVPSDTVSVPLNHEVSARLLAVPKTAKSPRLIASEPTEHQWCQQVIRTFLVDKLKASYGDDFICFGKQELSGQMALSASKDRSLATIDLSDASDRLSCWAVERLLRNNQSLLHALHACRTRSIRDDLSRTQSTIRLKKFASQGTAVTFPIQTIFFLCIALGVCSDGDVTVESIDRLRHSVRIFGDDIIIPNDRYAAMTAVLHYLGLKVNVNKSFTRGLFRESCGTDAYNGYDVTAVKPTSVIADGPSSRQAVIDTTNNLFYKGYWNASISLESTIAKHVLRHVAIKRPEDEGHGLASFSGRDRSHLRTRWNSDLHRREYRVWRISNRTTRQAFGERFALLQFFTEGARQEPLRTLHSGVAKIPYSSTDDVFTTIRRIRASNRHEWRNAVKLFVRKLCDTSSYESGVANRPRTSDGTGWEPLYY